MQVKQENQRCELYVHTAVWGRKQTPFRWHKNCEIVIPLDKKCSFWVDGKIIHAKKGDIVFINPQYVHSFIVEEDKTSIGLVIFDVKTVFNTSAKFVPLKSHITAEEIGEIEGLREKLDSLYEYAKEERKSEKIEDNPIMHSLIATYYLLLARHFPAEEKAPPQKKLADFYKILDYVNENFRENINIKTIAKALFMSREKVSSIFYKYSNSRLSDYIDNLRINNVNNLILEGESVTNAAHISGFQSIRTFNNTYKRVVGYSPTEYIKLNK